MKTADALLARARATGFAPGVLGLTILPTEKCNFRCVYCYESFPNVRMVRPTIEAIKFLLKNRSADLTHLSIGWFGGEPLLESNTVIEISEVALQLSIANKFSYSGHITTNGFFLNSLLFERLTSRALTNFQISLDGSEEWHDKTRKSANNKGTFSSIMTNLLSMRQSKSNFEVTLRLHIHKDNIDSVRQLITEIGANFGGDTRFKVNIQKIIQYYGEHRISVAPADSGSKKALYDHLSKLLLKEQIVRDEDLVQCCYASLPNHFVIRANGKLQKCTVALYDERNDVGELNLDGSIKWYDRERLLKWSAGLLTAT